MEQIKQVLVNLPPNHAGAMQLTNGIIANYGKIKVEETTFLHVTGKGLREMYSNNFNTVHAERLRNLPEGDLIKLELWARTPIDQIQAILN